MTKPRISIIIPAFNAEKFLRRAIASCEDGESYTLEIIVADDGSTDGTKKLIRSLAENDQRIITLLNSHIGVSATRNSALALATGRYIVLLDADDELVPGWLATGVRHLEPNPSLDGVYGSYMIHHDHTGRRQTRTIPERLSRRLMLRDNPLPINSIMLRTTIYAKLGAFDVKYHTHEDWLYWLRATYDGWRLARLDDSACIIYIHGYNASANWRLMSQGRIDCLNYAEEHFCLSSDEQWELRGRRAVERFFSTLEDIYAQQYQTAKTSANCRALLITLTDLPWTYNRALRAAKLYLWILFLMSSASEYLGYTYIFNLPHLLDPIRRWSHLAPTTQHELGYA